MWHDWVHLAQDWPVAGSCEQSISLGDEESVDQLNDCQVMIKFVNPVKSSGYFIYHPV